MSCVGQCDLVHECEWVDVCGVKSVRMKKLLYAHRKLVVSVLHCSQRGLVPCEEEVLPGSPVTSGSAGTGSCATEEQTHGMSCTIWCVYVVYVAMVI